MAKFTAEKIMEENLINELINGESQWTYRADLNTEEKLWANFKEKLEHNNTSILDGNPLTDQEFKQIQNQLNFINFYEAGKWLVGENGNAKVEVQREDASLGTIRLNVLRKDEIAGGGSTYEIINQAARFKTDENDRNRFFDVSLLINGLPLIHIELKNRNHPYMDGFRQIKKYIGEGKFTGIFSAIQIFVVTNGVDTKYIAAAREDKLKEQFLTAWVDKENKPVKGYLEFAKSVLSIPQAHRMVTQYTVLDSEKKAIIVLRPYQIHAIEAIKEASEKELSGYVWHTTGSGKTLTSYKVARNLLQIPSIDKTIFIVDRVDLDQQTTSSFTAYAENDSYDIDETDNVSDLRKKINSNDKSVIITTIQKLNHLLKRLNLEKDTKKYKDIRDLRIAFIVDECHRAVSSEKQRELKRFFKNSLWYGFTGTPIFEENKKIEKGDLERTTEEQYGKRLHEYTVKEAIYDGAVLGFQIEYKRTFSDDELDDIVESVLKSQNKNKNIAELSEIEKEELIPKEVYKDIKHVENVVNEIVNKSRNKFGLNKGKGKAYSAILTTSSIEMAQKYYDVFKQVKNNESEIKISEKVQSLASDFPKFAITYSVTENEEDSSLNQEKMEESIIDYNNEFGTNFSLGNIKAYNQDINSRLARKHDRYLARSEQLDIVIVVDRLLTGFDAPCLSTLFMDRPVTKPQHLIQAFSRTNRIFDKDKKYGQIVTFQTPNIYEKKVKEALVLYSNGGENEVVAPTWDESLIKFEESLKNLKSILKKPEEFENIFGNLDKMKKFAKAYQGFDRNFAAIQVYSAFDREEFLSAYNLTDEEIENYHGVYVNIIEEIRRLTQDDDEDNPIEIDIEYEIESIRKDKIDYDYIINLIQAYVPEDEKEENKEFRLEDSKEIDEFITNLSLRNEELGKIMLELWNSIKDNPKKYTGTTVSSQLDKMIDKAIDSLLKDFSDKWHVGFNELKFLVYNYKVDNELQIGEAELKRTSDYDKYKGNTEKPVIKLKYWRIVKEEYTRMILENILPLLDR